MVAKKPYIFESRYWPTHIEGYHIQYIPNMVVIKPYNNIVLTNHL